MAGRDPAASGPCAPHRRACPRTCSTCACPCACYALLMCPRSFHDKRARARAAHGLVPANAAAPTCARAALA
eukprot:14044119-Alexandrium_andersonii.AAC.1